MSVFRSYFSAQATLLRNNLTNNSRNPIIELSYGGGLTPNTTKIGRYIFRAELDGLYKEISLGELKPTNTVSHKVHFKNVIALSPELKGTEFMDAKRGNGITAFIFPLQEEFEEGSGLDYLYTPTVSYGFDARAEAPNWEYRKTNVKWDKPGVFDTNDPVEALDSFRLEQGNEDMVFDITDYMNEVLFEGRPHFGLGIALAVTIETLALEQRRVVTFFSKYTQSFFEPYIESNYGEHIWEDRCEFTLDNPNYLYLQTKVILAGIEKVEIFDQDDRLIIRKSGDQIEQLRTHLYRTKIQINGSAYPDAIMFRDVWHCKLNGRTKKVDQEFTLAEEEIVQNMGNDEFADYSFNVSGIRHNETIVRSPQKRRVIVNGKRMFAGSIDTNPELSGLTYRLYMLQGKNPIEVIPPTPVDKIYDLVFFDIDLTWLIPQQYYLEVRLETGGREIKSAQPVKFRVVAS